MPSAGVARHEEIRTGYNTGASGTAKYLCVSAGTNQSEIVTSGAAERILGVTIEEMTTQNRDQQYCCDGVVAVLAGAAINRLTDGFNTMLVTDASGRVIALSAVAGTYWVVGEMDNSSAAAGAANDIVHMLIWEEADQVIVAGS